MYSITQQWNEMEWNFVIMYKITIYYYAIKISLLMHLSLRQNFSKMLVYEGKNVFCYPCFYVNIYVYKLILNHNSLAIWITILHFGAGNYNVLLQ